MSSDTDSFEDLSDIDVESLGRMYLAAKLDAWTNAYDRFESFISEFKKEFGRGRMKGESIALYDEMMELSQEARGIKEDYDNEVHDVQHAFLYGGNQDVSPDEFRRTVTDVLEGERDWEYFARENQP